jgi:hypothetical protein
MWALTKGSLHQGHVRVLGHIGGSQSDDTKVDDVDHNLDSGVGRGTNSKNFACESVLQPVNPSQVCSVNNVYLCPPYPLL